MIYGIDIAPLPDIIHVYQVRRRTVWQMTDPSHVLIYVRDGTCSVTIDDGTYLLSPGDLFFIPRGQSYVRKPVGDTFCTLLYIHFSADEPRLLSENEASLEIAERKEAINRALLSDLPRPSDHTLYLSSYMPGADHKDELCRLADDAMSQFSKSHLESALCSSLSLCRMLAIGSGITLSAFTDTVLPERRVPSKLKHAIAYIRQNYSRSITLTELCDRCHVSKQQMIRYFSSELHTTPMHYIMLCRINRAKELFLNQPQLSVGEIALEVGFSDPHYFSRAFKKFSGETPSAFIRRIRNFDEKTQ